MSRRVTIGLTALATALLLGATAMLDRTSGLPVLPVLAILAALALGTLAVSRAWTRPLPQSSSEGSVAGPT